ncbi:MAG: LysR family transcriptional regulator [Burkholderiales bacterium]|jgi:LysR family carnitine catabolism transcriptional activator|nr:LysR family transcriptional regulator [Burkholderiales bacterium]
MNNHLTLNELEVFLQIAETRSFRQAAERMHVSQPALSRTLQSAEWKLSARLFDRNTRRVELSSAGQELLPIATRVLSEFRGSLSDLSEFIAGRRGRVAVASLPSAAAALLPSAIALFGKTHPQVMIDLQPFPAEKVQDLVRDGHVDLALSIRPADERELSYEPLIRDEFVLICPADHALAASRSAGWAEFARHPYITSGTVTSVRHIADRVLKDSGMAITPRYESSNLAVLGAMVTAGLGISAIPRLALRLIDSTHLAVVPLRKPAVHRELGLLSRRSRSLPAAATRFMDVLRAQAKTLPGTRRQ